MRSIALLVPGLVAALGFAELAVRVAGLGVTTFTRGALHRFDTEVGWICNPVVDVYGQPTPDLERAWRVVDALVARMRDRTRDAGGRLLLVLVAVRDAVDAARFEALFEGSRERAEWDRPARRLAAIAAARGVPFLDLSPVVRAQPDRDALFLDRDGHWSARGHALADRGVAAAIRAAESAERLHRPLRPVASPAALR